MDSGRSIRAVKNNLPTPSGEVAESEGLRWMRVRRNGPGAARKVQCPRFLALSFLALLLSFPSLPRGHRLRVFPHLRWLSLFGLKIL